MPTVPTTTPTIGLNVPGVNAPYTREYGKLGHSIASTGADIATTGVDTILQIKQAEASDAAANAHYQYQLDADAKLRDLKLNNGDGYMHDSNTGGYVYNDDNSRRTITQEFHDWSNDRYQQDQQNMPSELASELYRNKTLPYISSQVALLNGDAQQMKVKSWDDNWSMRVQGRGNDLVENPGGLAPKSDAQGRPVYDQYGNRAYSADLSGFYNHTNNTAEEVQSQVGYIHNSVEAQEKTRKAYEQLSHDTLQGAYDQIYMDKKLSDPARTSKVMAWIDAVNGDDPQSQFRKNKGLPVLSDMMDPLQKSTELHKLLSLLPSAKAADKSDYNKLLEETTNALKGHQNPDGSRSAGISQPGAAQEILRQTQVYASMGKEAGGLSPIEAGQNVGKIFAAQEINKSLSDTGARMLPPDQRIALAEKSAQNAQAAAQAWAQAHGISYSTDVGAISSNEIRSEINSAIHADEEKKQGDFAGWYQTLPPGKKLSLLDYDHPTSLAINGAPQAIQSGISNQRAAWKASTYGNESMWRPVSKDASSRLSNSLTDPTIPDGTVVKGINGMKTGFGQYYPQVIDQMIKDNKLGPEWILSKWNNSLMAISSIRGSKYIDENFKTVAEARGVKEDDLRNAVSGQMSDWIKTQAQPYNMDSQRFAASVNKAVTNYAKQLYITRLDASPEDVAKDAFNELAGQHVSTEKASNPGWLGSQKGTYIIPNEVNNAPITSVDKSNIRSNMNDALTEDAIKKINPYIPKQANGQTSDFADKFPGFVARSAYPVYHEGPEGAGYNIWYKSGNDGTPTMLYTNDGKNNARPAFIPLDQLRRTPAPGAVQNLMNKATGLLTPNPSTPKAPSTQKFFPGVGIGQPKL